MFDRSVWRFPSCEDEDGRVGGMGEGGACLLLAATAEGDLLLETVSVATLFSDSRRFRLTMSSLEVPVPVPLALLLITAGEDFLACLLSTCTYSLQSTCTYTHTHTHTHTPLPHFPFYTSCLSHQFEKLTNPPIHYGPNLNSPFKEKVNSFQQYKSINY